MTRLPGAGVALALWLAISVVAAAEPVPVLSAPQQARYEAMLPELRCLVCQNESLAESQAPLAEDLRVQIRRHLAAGDSDAQVKAYLTDRYGEFVLYRPPMEPKTWLLWAGPFVLVVAGLAAAARFVVGTRRAAAAHDADKSA